MINSNNNLSDKEKIIFDEIQNVLSGTYQENDFNNKLDTIYYYHNDCVSLDDLTRSIKGKYISSLGIKQTYFSDVNYLLKDSKYKCKSLAFDVNTKQIKFELFDCKKTFEFKLEKIDNKLCIVENTNEFNKEKYLFRLLGEVLNVFYDKNLEYETFKPVKAIKSVNSNFLIDIFRYNFKAYLSDDIDFSLMFDCGLFLDFCECNSPLLKKEESLKIMECKIFDKIFVKIEDCPEWLHTELNHIKNKKIDEYDRFVFENEKKLRKEKNKQKIKRFFNRSIENK